MSLIEAEFLRDDLTSVGYRYFDVTGAWVGARVTAGIVQDPGNPAHYFADVTYPAGAIGVTWNDSVEASAVVSYLLPQQTTISGADIRAAIGLASANLDTQLAAIPTAEENFAAVMKGDWTTLTGEASRSLLNAARFQRNGFTISPDGVTLTVLKEDDSTAAYTRTLTNDPDAAPITGVGG